MHAIVDTGPLVAFFDRSERYHRWTVDRIEELDAPLLVCEPVLTETIYLLARFPKAQDALFGLLQNGALAVAFRLKEHIGVLHRLLRKYRDTPMSLADACVVRMAEIHEDHFVLTLNSDFAVYRKHGRHPIALMHPAAMSVDRRARGGGRWVSLSLYPSCKKVGCAGGCETASTGLLARFQREATVRRSAQYTSPTKWERSLTRSVAGEGAASGTLRFFQ